MFQMRHEKTRESAAALTERYILARPSILECLRLGFINYASLAREIAKYGINVNMVAPGMVRTPMTEEALKAKPDYYNGRIPIGRVAEPEEVAQAAVFLASKCADYYTGITFDATGGMLMR